MSSKQGPPFCSDLVAATDSGSSAGCINIQPIPSALQSILRNVGLDGLYAAKTVDVVIANFMSSNNYSKSGVHTMSGISCLNYPSIIHLNGLILVSK